MEEKGKNNTALLTVIAIATLLVAVVGATFAYFSTGISNDNQKVTVTATATAADTFVVNGSATISLDVTADNMQKEAGSDTYTVTGDTGTGSLTVTLTAGSANARCTYDLAYIPTNAYTNTQSSLVEFGIIGSSSIAGNSFGNTTPKTPVNAGGAGTTLTDGTGTVTGILLKSGASITNSASAAAPTVETWTFTGDYYNLATIDQAAAVGRSFGGEIKVINVSCENVESLGV